MKHLICGAILLLFNSSCSTVYYLFQASKGQLTLFNRGKPLDEVAKDPRTDPKLAGILAQVPEMKIYGEKFGLKPTPNYRNYVQLDQESVVYVVTVCDPLKFDAKIFHFPIIGSFNYLGWFKESDAEQFAKQFEKDGQDIDVRGASAYSTLGWFRDPLLSSMVPTKAGQILPSALGEVLNTVLHESVHATLYVNDQSYFNEGIASFVADYLTKKYFLDRDLMGTPEWKEYESRERYGEQTRLRMLKAVEDLKQIYSFKIDDEEKLLQKKNYLAVLQNEFPRFRKITNATLVQFLTYHSSEEDFKRLFQKKHEDVQAFLTALAGLKPRDFERPQQEGFKGLFEKL